MDYNDFPLKKHITNLRTAQHGKNYKFRKLLNLGPIICILNGALATQIHYNMPLNTNLP